MIFIERIIYPIGTTDDILHMARSIINDELEERGISQRKLADLVGMDRGYFGHLVRGTYKGTASEVSNNLFSKILPFRYHEAQILFCVMFENGETDYLSDTLNDLVKWIIRESGCCNERLSKLTGIYATMISSLRSGSWTNISAAVASKIVSALTEGTLSLMVIQEPQPRYRRDQHGRQNV